MKFRFVQGKNINSLAVHNGEHFDQRFGRNRSEGRRDFPLEHLGCREMCTEMAGRGETIHGRQVSCINIMLHAANVVQSMNVYCLCHSR